MIGKPCVTDELMLCLFARDMVMQLKDNMLPEIVQATKNITFDNCGRRFGARGGEMQTGQAILENWLDIDGSAGGLGEYTYMVSGMARTRAWWNADEEGRFCDVILCRLCQWRDLITQE